MIKEKSKSRKGRFSKMIIAVVIALNVAFTIAILFVFCKIGSEPSGLVVAFFGFTTAELWSLAKIKRDKVQNQIT